MPTHLRATLVLAMAILSLLGLIGCATAPTPQATAEQAPLPTEQAPIPTGQAGPPPGWVPPENYRVMERIILGEVPTVVDRQK